MVFSDSGFRALKRPVDLFEFCSQQRSHDAELMKEATLDHERQEPSPLERLRGAGTLPRTGMEPEIVPF